MWVVSLLRVILLLYGHHWCRYTQNTIINSLVCNAMGTRYFMISRLFTRNTIIRLSQVFMRFIITSDIRFLRLSKQLFCEKKILLGFREMWNLYDAVKKTERLPGDVAELGVYSGGSAKLMCEAKGQKSLYLFDTFCGLPANNFSTNKIKEGEINGGALKEVKDYLIKYANVFFYEGIFPESTVRLKNRLPNFSLVHLDADIYEATLDGLKFFYPLMVKNGIILIHDYQSGHLPGVKKAVSEFLKNKPEKIINLQGKGITVFSAVNEVINRFYDSVQGMIIKQ